MPNLPAPLKTACVAGDLDKTKSLYYDLISEDPSIKSDTLSQIAIISAKNSHPPILSFCCSEGLEIDAELENDPLLCAACDSGSTAVFRVLLDHGMNVNSFLELDGSALVSACRVGNLELVKFLLDENADPNNGFDCGGYEALLWAIIGSRASLDIVKLLLANGVIVKGSGALIAAAEHGNLEAIKLLLEHGKRNKDIDLEEVGEYGAYDPRKLDDQGTALYKAAAHGHHDIVDILLKAGADTRYKDRKGRSVADIAEENGHGIIATRVRM